jgi:hypothetical protein
MNPLSAADAEKSRKYHALALQRIASVGQKAIAERLDTSESTVSRLVNGGDLEKVVLVLAIVGLKVVPSEMKCYSSDTISALLNLTRDHLNSLETPEQLSFD